MPILVPRLAALLVGLLAPPGSAADAPALAEVSAAVLDVFDEPDARSFSPGRLQRGDRVTVRGEAQHGWLAIAPPANSFSWIEQKALGKDESGGRAEVIVPRALVRSGSLGARMPGPPGTTLSQGTMVRLLDLPTLTTGSGRSTRLWRAIATPANEVRYVRAEGIRLLEAPTPPTAEETRVSFNPPGQSPAAPPGESGAAIARIEAAHRAEIRRPVDQWRLGPIRAQYQALLKQSPDPATAQAVRERLEIVARHEEMAEAAREIETILQKSRRRDQVVARVKNRLASAEHRERRPFAAEGMVQSSSRQVNGKRGLALIGPEGAALCFLEIPDGLDAQPMLGRTVGVRGELHYSDELRARLIKVRSMEPLDEEP